LDNTQLKGAEEGTISIMKGVAIRLQDLVGSITRSGDGLLDSRIKSEQKQIKNITGRIEQIDANLLRRRDRLTAQFLAMEAALGAFNSQSQFLTLQLANINANFRPQGR